MSSWTKSYPGKVLICHNLGKFREDVQAHLEANNFKPGLIHYSSDDVYWSLNSRGYGPDRVFWFEIHFSNEKKAIAYQDMNGGDLFHHIKVYADEGEEGREFLQRLDKLLKDYGVTTKGERPKFIVIDNTKHSSDREKETPDAFVYSDDLDSLMLLKLAIGTKR